MIPSRFKDYLLRHGAASTSHSGSTLWRHLAAVHQILSVSGSPEAVCIAGLFHSIYGTATFKRPIVAISKRSEIQNLIGQYAEELVWQFCTLPRPQIIETTLREQDFEWLNALQIQHPKSQFWEDLVRLECANLLEQKFLHNFQFLTRHARKIRMLDGEGFSIWPICP